MFIGSSRDPIFSIKAAEIEAVYRAKELKDFLQREQPCDDI